MKRILFFPLALLITVGMLSSCQKEQISNPNGTFGNLRSSCEDCVETPFEVTDSQTQSWGGPQQNMHSKTVSYVAYNTETDFVVKVSYTRSNGNPADLIKVTVNGDEQEILEVASGSESTFTFPLTESWAACDVITFSVYQVGQNNPMTLNGTYELREYCGCDYEGNNLSGTGACNGTQRTATYTFSSEEGVAYYKIQGGLTAKSSNVTVSGSSGTWTVKAVGKGDNFIITGEGLLDECGAVTVTINWTSTNGGSEITGDWTVKDLNGNELAPSVGPLTCE